MSEIGSNLNKVAAVPLAIGRKALGRFFKPAEQTEAEVMSKADYLASGFDSNSLMRRIEVMGKIAGLAISAILDPTSANAYAEVIRNVGIDDLTGLANRLAFVAKLEAESMAEGSHAIMMFDLIKFKSINDKLGQHVGDEFLKVFGQALSQNFRTNLDRPQDVLMASRIGGDEFAVLLQDNDALNANLLPLLSFDKAVKALSNDELLKLMGHYRIEEFGVRVGSSMIGENIVSYDEAIHYADHKTHTDWAVMVCHDETGDFSLYHYIHKNNREALVSIADNPYLRHNSEDIFLDGEMLYVPIPGRF